MSDKSPIVFALDFKSVEEAERAAMRVRDAIGMVKVGLELFVEGGPRALDIGKACGLPVFLDLKLHDIPETVERAVGRAAALGANILTVHASGGPAMLSRAVKRAASERGTGADGLQIAAVTVLTSFDAADLTKIGVAREVLAQVRLLARMAFDEGVRAFVCSPGEVAALRQELGPEAVLITPGIRPSDTKMGDTKMGDDQKRVATPASASADGANWLVVGRPIRDAADPLAMARAMRDEALVAVRAVGAGSAIHA